MAESLGGRESVEGDRGFLDGRERQVFQDVLACLKTSLYTVGFWRLTRSSTGSWSTWKAAPAAASTTCLLSSIVRLGGSVIGTSVSIIVVAITASSRDSSISCIVAGLAGGSVVSRHALDVVYLVENGLGRSLAVLHLMVHLLLQVVDIAVDHGQGNTNGEDGHNREENSRIGYEAIRLKLVRVDQKTRLERKLP